MFARIHFCAVCAMCLFSRSILRQRTCVGGMTKSEKALLCQLDRRATREKKCAEDVKLVVMFVLRIADTPTSLENKPAQWLRSPLKSAHHHHED